MRTSGVADLAGRVLAGRYRLTAPIGTGASGRVYAASDVRLRRRVAVKVLHAALADDAGFLRRFGAEAQVAAGLHHPNVVAVHDWGEDETPFMVMELLEGGSLRGMLDRGSHLSPAQAVAVGRGVAAALDYAHTRGLVHRDIKPANLLFDEHGGVRVADFGLARALAEASWTEPAGAVLGTARYAAPEQVRGVVDARSDLYSLALVLVEAVTGSVPFGGETSLSALLARVDRHLDVPPELGGLAAVLERAGRSDPTERWPDAAAFGAALAEAAAELPPPARLVLPGALVEGDDPHPTEVRPGPGAEPTRLAARVVVGSARPVEVPLPFGVVAPGDRAPEPARQGQRSRSWRSRGTRPRRTRSGPRRLIPVIVPLLVVLASATAAFAVGRAAGPRVRVPNLVGRIETAARAAADQSGLRVQVSGRTSDDPAGTVISQVPEPGTWFGEGRRVRLVVSEGPPPVPLPDVGGQPEAQARSALETAGFEVTTSRRHDEEVGAGSVIAQEPPATQVAPPGSQVALVTSDGPSPVVVPNVVGKAFADAEKTLAAKRLGVKRTEAFSDDVEAGDVIRQEPVAGEEVPRDSKVTLVVSKGPDVVQVPDLRGETVEDAVAILEQLGLEVDVSGYRPGREVKRHSPSRGETVRRGETVTLYL